MYGGGFNFVGKSYAERSISPENAKQPLQCALITVVISMRSFNQEFFPASLLFTINILNLKVF